MHIIVYKTTNQLNTKFYIGIHKTENLDDGYLGSGKRLKDAIKHHGPDNFKREILQFCSSIDEAQKIENQLVTEELVNNTMCYNMCIGGGYPPSWGSTGPRPDASKRMKENNPSSLMKGDKHWSKNTVVVEIEGMKCRVSKDDSRYVSGEIQCINKGRESSAKGKPMRTSTCPYCNKTGAINLMIRWHFNNCKQR